MNSVRQHGIQPGLSGPGQRGIGMIEVLVALLILSIGVLGYAGLQLRALNSTGESHYRAQATALAQDIVERITVNPDSRSTYLTASSWTQTFPAGDRSKPSGWDTCFSSTCTSAQIATWDILQTGYLAWTLLPGGKVSVSTCATALACVVVGWSGADPTSCDPSADDCISLEVMP